MMGEFNGTKNDLINKLMTEAHITHEEANKVADDIMSKMDGQSFDFRIEPVSSGPIPTSYWEALTNLSLNIDKEVEEDPEYQELTLTDLMSSASEVLSPDEFDRYTFLTQKLVASHINDESIMIQGIDSALSLVEGLHDEMHPSDHCSTIGEIIAVLLQLRSETKNHLESNNDF